MKNTLIYISFFFILHPLLLTDQWYLGWDAMRESYGDMLYGAKAVLSGYFPLWNHLERGGYPFFSDPQTAILYPPTWLIYLGIYLFGDGIWVALARSIMHFVIGAFGMRKLLEELGFSQRTLWFGSLIWMSSSRFAKSKDSAALWSIVWLPWLTWIIYRFFKLPNLKHAIYLAFLMTLAFYAGYPPNLFRIILFLIPISIYFIYQEYIYFENKISAKKYLLDIIQYLVIAVILTFLLCLPGILATIDILPYSLRTELSEQDLFGSKQKIFDFIDIILPRFFSHQGYAYLYLGILPAFFIYFALRFHPSHFTKVKKSFIHLLLGISIFFTLLACSKQGLLLTMMMDLFPVFKLWRIPEQYLLIAVFAFILISCIGLEKYQENTSMLQAYLKKILLPLSLIYLIYILIYQFLKNKYSLTLMSYPLGLLSIVLLMIWALYKYKDHQLSFVLALLLLIDLSIQNHNIYTILDKTPQFKRDQLLIDQIQEKQLKIKDLRVLDHEYFQYRIGARLGIQDFQGRFSTMVSARHHEYMKYAEKHRRLYALAGIDYIAGMRALGSFYEVKNASDLSYFSPLWTQEDANILEQLSQIPIDQKNPQLAYIDFSTIHDNALRTKIQQKPQRSDSSLISKTTVEIIENQWGDTRLKVTHPQNGIIVILNHWFPHIEATFDNHQKAEVFRVNDLFQGVYLTQEFQSVDHVYIDLKYRPWHTIYALIFALILTLVLLGVLYKKEHGNEK